MGGGEGGGGGGFTTAKSGPGVHFQKIVSFNFCGAYSDERNGRSHAVPGAERKGRSHAPVNYRWSDAVIGY